MQQMQEDMIKPDKDRRCTEPDQKNTVSNSHLHKKQQPNIFTQAIQTDNYKPPSSQPQKLNLPLTKSASLASTKLDLVATL